MWTPRCLFTLPPHKEPHSSRSGWALHRRPRHALQELRPLGIHSLDLTSTVIADPVRCLGSQPARFALRRVRRLVQPTPNSVLSVRDAAAPTRGNSVPVWRRALHAISVWSGVGFAHLTTSLASKCQGSRQEAVNSMAALTASWIRLSGSSQSLVV